MPAGNQPSHSALIADRLAWYGQASDLAKRLAQDHPDGGAWLVLLPQPEQQQYEPGRPTRVAIDRAGKLLMRGSHRLATPEEVAAGRALQNEQENKNA